MLINLGESLLTVLRLEIVKQWHRQIVARMVRNQLKAQSPKRSRSKRSRSKRKSPDNRGRDGQTLKRDRLNPMSLPNSAPGSRKRRLGKSKATPTVSRRRSTKSPMTRE